MQPLEYFLSLDIDEQKAYADRVGTSLNYLRLHLFPKKGSFRKRPGYKMLVNLVIGSEGHVLLEAAKQYFYTNDIDAMYEEIYRQSRNYYYDYWDDKMKPLFENNVQGFD